MGKESRRGTRASRNVVRAGAATDLAARIEGGNQWAVSAAGSTGAPSGRNVEDGNSIFDVVSRGFTTGGSSDLGGQIDTSGPEFAQRFNPMTRQWERQEITVQDQPRLAGVKADMGQGAEIQPRMTGGPAARITRAEVQGGGTGGNDRWAGNVEERMAQEKDRARNYTQAMADYEQQLRELNAASLKAVQEGADDIARQYDEQIREIEKQLADTRVQLKRSMAAYEAYAAQVAPQYIAAVESAIAGEEASKEALAGRAEAAVAQIESNRAAAVEDVEEFADLIGVGAITPGSVDQALGEFGLMMQEAASGSIEDIGRIAAAGAKFATALAKAEKERALFDNEIEKEGLEAQIQGEIDDLVEHVAKLEKDKQEAVARAMAAWEPVGGFENPDEAFKFVFDHMALNGEWDLDEQEAVWAMFGDFLGSDGPRTHEGVIDWIDNYISENAATLLGEHLQSKGVSLGDIPDGHKDLFDKLLTGTESERVQALGVLQRLYTDADLSYELVDSLFLNRTDFTHLIETVDAYETHVKEWNSRKSVAAKKGSSAPNNWANRNAPQYKARREVGVPTFVNMFQAQFGKEGTGREYVGGVTSSFQGALRDPSNVGGGKAVNSDHQSGGAVDLYADSVEELEAIERWASTQPGVSYVTYSGNKYHETGKAGGASSGVAGRGHVHVSLQIGYWG